MLMTLNRPRRLRRMHGLLLGLVTLVAFGGACESSSCESRGADVAHRLCHHGPPLFSLFIVQIIMA